MKGPLAKGKEGHENHVTTFAATGDVIECQSLCYTFLHTVYALLGLKQMLNKAPQRHPAKHPAKHTMCALLGLKRGLNNRTT